MALETEQVERREIIKKMETKKTKDRKPVSLLETVKICRGLKILNKLSNEEIGRRLGIKQQDLRWLLGRFY